jgi:hypothetical protein
MVMVMEATPKGLEIRVAINISHWKDFLIGRIALYAFPIKKFVYSIFWHHSPFLCIVFIDYYSLPITLSRLTASPFIVII